MDSVSASLKPPCRVTCPHQADGQHSRGGPFFAIKPVRSAATSFPRSSRRDTRACIFGPIGPSSCDPRLRRLTVCVGLCRRLGQQQPTLNARRTSLRSAQCDRGAMHRVHREAAVPGGARKARSKHLPAAVPIRSLPYEGWASPRPRSRATREVASDYGRAEFRHASTIDYEPSGQPS
jgi:hypothetical protein